MTYTPKQLREWVELISMDEYDYRKPSVRDVQEALEAFAAKIEECERLRESIACIDAEAVAWAIGKLTAFGVGMANQDSAIFLDRLQAALSDIAALKEPK